MLLQTVTIGAATLMLGDCIERMRELPDASVDLVLTDVPYSSGATREAGRTAYNKTMTPGTKGGRDQWFGSDSLSTRGFMSLIRSCAVEWQRVLVPGGHLLCSIDWRMEDNLVEAVDEEHRRELYLKAGAYDSVESADLRRIGPVTWDKTYFGMGQYFRRQSEFIHHFTKGKGNLPLRRNVPDIVRCPPVRMGLHPTEKPDGLLGELITTVCPEGGTVLDCFAGSFSTGVAAVTRGRRFIGIEREQRFFETGWQRLADLNGWPT